MDIEINEVQEIIKNLESSGELSIKEEKYLKIAKLCVQLAADRDAATLEYDYLNDQIEYWKNKSINITEQRNELGADLPPLEHENVHYADAAEMEIAALRQRIAELESRTVTVKLPQRLQPGADGWDDWYVHSDDEGEYLKFDDVLAMLTAAGIKWEAE
jgi:DNA repair exonuclease SbcCD ATPase subunit